MNKIVNNIQKAMYEWLRPYCKDIRIKEDSVVFNFNGCIMRLCYDAFTHRFTISHIICCGSDNYDESCYSRLEMENLMTKGMFPYVFTWDDYDNEITVIKSFDAEICRGTEFLIKVEVLRLFYLLRQVDKVVEMGKCTDFPDDENWMQFLLTVVDKWVAADLLDITILYLHGFASSGNSGTAKDIQTELPNCHIICPDLPVSASDALCKIRNYHEGIDLVIGTSMGGLLAMFAPAPMKILVNPSFHVSDMMYRRLDYNNTVTIPFYKTRQNGETHFELTRNIANQFKDLYKNVFRKSHLDEEHTLALFGTSDDVVDCREDYLRYFNNIRYFKGGHRLNKEAIQEVMIPAILQMVINKKMS